MEDYIFIIIAIILSAVGAISRGKKQKIAQMESEGQPFDSQKPIFDTPFHDPFFDEPESFSPVPAPKPMRESSYQPLRKEALKVNIKDEDQKKSTVLNEEVSDETTFNSTMKDFSFKKAIIYSEILNRKY